MRTAVEWLIDELRNKHGLSIDLYSEFEQAKEMEKEQIIAFAKKCIHKALESDILMAYNQVEQYYNETFKQQEQ